jgi:non-heme chloroperoxidase
MPIFTTSDDVRLHYRDEGGGPPIVFAAGWAMDGSWWRAQSPLSGSYRTVVVDPRAQGRSEKVTRGIRVGRGAHDLHDLFQHLDLSEVTLVAWSRSASIALAYWELFGEDRIARFVLIGVTPCMASRSDWQWGYREPPTAFQERLIADPEGSVRAVIVGIFLVPPPEPVIEEFVRSTLQTPPEAGAKMLDDHGVIDWRDMLPTITIPTLVCVGRHDHQAPLAAAEVVADMVPGGELLVFENSAHAPFYEEPELFNEALDAFIQRHLTRDGQAGATSNAPNPA